MSRVVVRSVYTKDNPMPFEKALEHAAPAERRSTLEIHKDDGTVCMLPYCNKEHDEYTIIYKRVAVLKEVSVKSH